MQQEQCQQSYQPSEPASEPQQPYQAYTPEPAVPEQPYVAPVSEPEVVEEAKPSRPPLYYFEEVEERRAREREQLAAWYQPVPEPVQEPVAKAPPVSVPPVDPTPAVASGAEAVKQATAAAAASAPLFSPATDSAPRPQVKEGIGPQLPRPNRVRVPTRRELCLLWH